MGARKTRDFASCPPACQPSVRSPQSGGSRRFPVSMQKVVRGMFGALATIRMRDTDRRVGGNSSSTGCLRAIPLDVEARRAMLRPGDETRHLHCRVSSPGRSSVRFVTGGSTLVRTRILQPGLKPGRPSCRYPKAMPGGWHGRCSAALEAEHSSRASNPDQRASRGESRPPPARRKIRCVRQANRESMDSL
jgi:hypothetical protein